MSRRAATSNWDVNPWVKLSNVSDTSTPGNIYQNVLYENCIFRFTTSAKSTTEIKFLIGSTYYAVILGNNTSIAKTTKGNRLINGSPNLGTLSMSGVLVDTGDLKERLITVENLNKLMGDCRTSQGNVQTIYNMSVWIENVEYFGYCDMFSYSKGESSPFLYNFNLSFYFFDAKIDGFSVDGSELLRNAKIAKERPTIDESYELSDGTTDSDSELNDSTLSDTMNPDLYRVYRGVYDGKNTFCAPLMSYDTKSKDYTYNYEKDLCVRVGDVLRVKEVKDVYELEIFYAHNDPNNMKTYFIIRNPDVITYRDSGKAAKTKSTTYFFVSKSMLTLVEGNS